MITVSQNHIFQVSCCPFLKIDRITIFPRSSLIPSFNPFLFRKFPFIKCLIDNKKSFFITQLKKIRRKRIMACTDCITAQLFQNIKPSFNLFPWNCRSQSSGIVMKTDSFQFQIFTIKKKSFISIKPDTTETRICVVWLSRISFSFTTVTMNKDSDYSISQSFGLFISIF